MKKCYNCVYLSGSDYCSHEINYEIENDEFIGNKATQKDRFIPVYKMRSKNGLCGCNAKLYSSKYKRFCIVLGLFTICAIPYYYILKLLFE